MKTLVNLTISQLTSVSSKKSSYLVEKKRKKDLPYYTKVAYKKSTLKKLVRFFQGTSASLTKHFSFDYFLILTFTL